MKKARKSNDVGERVRALLVEAGALPQNSPARVTLLQEAADLAEAHRDTALAFEARHELIGAGLSTDQCEVMLVAFTWCLAQHDRDPEAFGAHRVLWEFRWVVSSLPTFPQITLEKIEEMKNEMARRYQMYGASPRSYALMCRKMAIDMGDKAEAATMDRWLRQCPEDWLSDGVETERGFDITYRLFRGEWAKAIQAAQPFLDRTIRSSHFEGQACADVLFPLLRAGRPEEAMPYHLRGYRLRKGDSRHLESLGKHVAFLALTGNRDKAIRLFSNHLPDALATTNAFTRLKFLLEALPIMDRLVKEKIDTIRIPRLVDCPITSIKGRVPVKDLRAWLVELTASLCHEYDQRNGNDFNSKRLKAIPRLQRWFQPCPLTE